MHFGLQTVTDEKYQQFCRQKVLQLDLLLNHNQLEDFLSLLNIYEVLSKIS